MKYQNDLDDLHVTLNHMSTCLPKDVKFTKTKYGGTFAKGNRSISVDIDVSGKEKVTDPIKIKNHNGRFGIKLHRLRTCEYTSIKDLVKKGLGIK